MFTVCLFIIHISVLGTLVMTERSGWINVSVPQERCRKWAKSTGLIKRSDVFHLNTYYSYKWPLSFHSMEFPNAGLGVGDIFLGRKNYKIEQDVTAHTLYSEQGVLPKSARQRNWSWRNRALKKILHNYGKKYASVDWLSGRTWNSAEIYAMYIAYIVCI